MANHNNMYDTTTASAAQSNSSSTSSVTVTSTAAQGSVTLQQQQQQFAHEFWEEQVVAAEQFDSDFKNHPLPLARIKKVMKSDPEVKVRQRSVPMVAALDSHDGQPSLTLRHKLVC
jgi:hypothetical protein